MAKHPLDVNVNPLEGILHDLEELVATAVLRGVPYEYTTDLAELAKRLRREVVG